MAENTPSNEHDAYLSLHALINGYIKEQRSRRRWGIFFRFFFFAWLAALLILLIPSENVPTVDKSQKSHVALVDLRGNISDNGDSDADRVGGSLREAFEDNKTIGVILRINSPGGTPVQAAYLYNEIRRLRKQHPNIKIYAVCTDICASAAYYVAAATDNIYANPSSLVGSIGVMFNGFGFVDTLQKLGVERRLFTAGDRKGFLDPFSPLQENDKQTVQTLMNTTYQQFIRSVKEGRGSRLKEHPELFSGLVWTGEQAMDLGLIDGFASAGEIARDIFKNENVVNYTTKPNFIEQISKRFGESFAGELVNRMGFDRNTLR